MSSQTADRFRRWFWRPPRTHGDVILDRRVSDLEVLNTELAAWQAATNADQRQVEWQFTTDDARVKLRHLYPN